MSPASGFLLPVPVYHREGGLQPPGDAPPGRCTPVAKFRTRVRLAHEKQRRLMPEIGVFSTAGLPAARRIELWERHNTAALIGLSCHTTEPGSLEATEVNVPLGRIQLARVTGSPHVVERTAEVIRHSPADAVAVYLTLRGEAWFRHRDGPRELRPGQILICDADRPFARGFARGLEELAIKVPRAALGLASLRSPVVAAFARGNDPYARALARLVDRAARAERAVAADEGTVLDLV